tara:strand:- start:15642 stop:15881 length:240 start_codon:yes stop_codon:yes gene_type:complete
MKYLLLMGLIMLSCQNKTWASRDRLEFNVDCVETGQTKQYCQCLLNCLQIEYANYKSASKNIKAQNVPEKLIICIEGCK